MSYIVRLDSPNPQKRLHNFSAYTRRNEPTRYIELIYPGFARQSEHVVNYVTADISKIEKLLFSLELFNDPRAFERRLDIDSFVDYYLINEFLGVNDAFSKSTYFFSDAQGKIKMGPV